MRRYRAFVHHIGRVLRLPPRDLLILAHVVMVLGVVELLVRWVSLPRLSRVLGVTIDLRPGRVGLEQLRPEELPERARRQLGWTWRVTDFWPFSQGPCLRRALVGGHLIRDLHPAVRLGVAGFGETFLAHAWLEVDGRPLEDIGEFKVFTRNDAG